jgi:hypothetical protein
VLAREVPTEVKLKVLERGEMSMGLTTAELNDQVEGTAPTNGEVFINRGDPKLHGYSHPLVQGPGYWRRNGERSKFKEMQWRFGCTVTGYDFDFLIAWTFFGKSKRGAVDFVFRTDHIGLLFIQG